MCKATTAQRPNEDGYVGCIRGGASNAPITKEEIARRVDEVFKRHSDGVKAGKFRPVAPIVIKPTPAGPFVC